MYHLWQCFCCFSGSWVFKCIFSIRFRQCCFYTAAGILWKKQYNLKRVKKVFLLPWKTDAFYGLCSFLLRNYSWWLIWLLKAIIDNMQRLYILARKQLTLLPSMNVYEISLKNLNSQKRSQFHSRWFRNL